MKITDHDTLIGKTRDFHVVGGSKTKQSRLETSLPPSSLANTNRDEIVFSSQKSQFAEYTTWKGIQNKTGIEKEDAVSFLVKELLDNAVDHVETTQYHNNSTAAPIAQPEIHIIIEKVQDKYLRITVCNSTYQTDSAFSSHTLKSIFDFNRYHSSKRNQLKITKGALGDALKEALCIPHILAHEAKITNWNYPLYIISQQKLFQIATTNFAKRFFTVLLLLCSHNILTKIINYKNCLVSLQKTCPTCGGHFECLESIDCWCSHLGKCCQSL
jgi:hypothetical protein